jgi:hypothetical protein
MCGEVVEVVFIQAEVSGERPFMDSDRLVYRRGDILSRLPPPDEECSGVV